MQPETDGQCPVPHTVSQESMYLLRTDTSQSIFPDHGNILGILDDYEIKLREHYALMLEHDPGRAGVVIARKVRSAARGPYGAIFTSRMIEDLAMRRGKERDEYIGDMGDKGTTLASIHLNDWYYGEYHEWTTAMDWLMAVAQVDLLEQSSPDALVFKSVTDSALTINGKLADAYEAAGETTVLDWRNYDGMKEMANIDREGIVVTFDTLYAGYLAILASGMIPFDDKEQIAKSLAQNLEPLTRIASINKNALPSVFGDKGNMQSLRRPASDLSRLNGVFRFEDGLLVPTHPSITDGPWREPANCAAMSPQKLNEVSTTDAVGEYHEEVNAGVPGVDELGRVRAVANFMLVGIDVAKRTFISTDVEKPGLKVYAHEAA